MSGNYYPTPPPRSPWSSPVVIGAIVVGVLVLALAVLLGFLLIPDDDTSDAPRAQTSSSSTTATPQISTRTVTATPSTVTTTSTVTRSTPTTTRATVTGPLPDVPGTDEHGFINGPRCNATDDPVVMVGQTNRSKVVVCQVGTQTGRYYYKGLAGGMGTEIGYPTRSGNRFVAVNGDTSYEMTPAALTITTDGAVISTEPMINYWTD